MLQFQVGRFRGVTDDGFLVVEMQGPPQPVSALREQHDKPDEETHGSDSVAESKTNKRKAEAMSCSEEDASKEHISLPTDSQGIVYKTNGTTEYVDGPFETSNLKQVIDCKYFQMVPCTKGELKDKFELWMNEEGQSENELNKEATRIFGKQVYGGKLYGNILVLKRSPGSA